MTPSFFRLFVVDCGSGGQRIVDKAHWIDTVVVFITALFPGPDGEGDMLYVDMANA